jgi:hypothetical protein
VAPASPRLGWAVVAGCSAVFALAGGYVRRLLDLFQAAQHNVTSSIMSTHPLMELDSGCDYIGIPCKYVWGHRLIVSAGLKWAQALTRLPYDTVFYIVYLVLLFTGYVVFFWYLRHWLDDVASLLGVSYLAAVYPLTQTNPDPAQMMLGLVLYCVGIVLIERNRPALVMLVTVVGVFNREEIGGLLILYAVRWFRLMPMGPFLRNCVGIAVAWGGPLWVARRALGVPASYVSAWTVGNLSTNVNGLIDSFVNPTPFHQFRIVFYLVLPAFAIPALYRGWHGVPLMFRRGAWFVPGYLAVLFVFSVLNETKQFMPLMAVVVPMGLTALLGTRSPRGPVLENAR